MDDSEIVETLRNLNFIETDIERFLGLYKTYNYEKAEGILLRYRQEMLDKIHVNQDKLYCLDYLLNKLKKGNEENDVK